MNLGSVPDPDMRVGVGQNLLVGPAEIADLDRAEGGGDATRVAPAKYARASSATKISSILGRRLQIHYLPIWR